MKRRPRVSFNEGEAAASSAADDPFGRVPGRIGAPVPCSLGMLRGLLFLCIVVFPSVAQAARILLVKPAGGDGTVLETFNRLRGELRVHGFQVLLVESAAGTRSGATDLSAMTELHGALAGVSLVPGSKPVSAEIWLAARENGSTGSRTVLDSGPKDAPLLLAIRVVDLLRTNLREFAKDSAPDPGVRSDRRRLVSPEVATAAGPSEKVGHPSRLAGLAIGEKSGNSPSSPGAQESHAPPVEAERSAVSLPVDGVARAVPPTKPAPDHPSGQATPAPRRQDAERAVIAPDGAAPTSPVEGAFRFSLSGGLVASFDYHLGLGLGPAVSARFRASQRLGFSLGFIGPVFGQSYEDTQVTASVREEILVLLVTLSAWRHGRIAQDVFIGPGGMHLAVHGQTRPPLAGRSSNTWVALAQAGTGISYQVLARLRVELSASALLLVPQPAIETPESRHPMSEPQFLACLALHLDF